MKTHMDLCMLKNRSEFFTAITDKHHGQHPSQHERIDVTKSKWLQAVYACTRQLDQRVLVGGRRGRSPVRIFTKASTVNVLTFHCSSIKEKITTSRKDVEESLQNRFSENEVEGFSKFKTEEQLRKELVRCTKDAESKQGDYFNRAGRMKRAGRQLTAFFADLHEFYKMFSGLSGLLNVVAPGSSEAANILFAVLIVAVNKKKTVDLMASAVKMLRNQLARIEILDNVYNTDRIRECVAEVYIQGIQFARDAVIYYSQRSILRLWQAINRPQSFLQEKVVELDISITNWKDEMMVLMHKRVSEMSENLSDLHNGNEGLPSSSIPSGHAHVLLFRARRTAA